MNLFELAFASFLYSGLTGYRESYLEFRRKVGGDPDFAIPAHHDFLLDWLNRWGCRFERDKRPRASSAIGQWHRRYGSNLCPAAKGIWGLNHKELDALDAAYQDLRDRPVFCSERGGKAAGRRIGPTAASKILFALRPRAALAWDEKMRNGLRRTLGVTTYRQFLSLGKDESIALERQCREHGIDLDGLPETLNRAEATLAQLIGEYYWVIHTKGIVMPDPEVLERWLSWSKAPASFGPPAAAVKGAGSDRHPHA
ncbi:MAG: hypothetical protein HPY71_14840 [Firmicutes bacterium]|nr:hypothetical protein [Bacillota bacterium]